MRGLRCRLKACRVNPCLLSAYLSGSRPNFLAAEVLSSYTPTQTKQSIHTTTGQNGRTYSSSRIGDNSGCFDWSGDIRWRIQEAKNSTAGGGIQTVPTHSPTCAFSCFHSRSSRELAAASASNPVPTSATVSAASEQIQAQRAQAVASAPADNSWSNMLGLWAWKKDPQAQTVPVPNKKEDRKDKA